MTDKTETAAPVESGDGLTSEEKAYFESRGEKSLPPEPEVKANDGDAQAKAEPEAKEPAEAKAEADNAPKDGDDGADDDAKPAEGRKIDYHVLKKERERRQALERSLAEATQRHQQDMARVNERLMQIMQAQQMPQVQKPAEPEPPAIPDPEQDIFAFAKYTQQELAALKAEKAEYIRRQQEAQMQKRQQAEQAQQRATYEKSIIDKYNEIGQIRAEQDAEFVPAYDYARQKRIEQLMRDEGMDEAAAKRQTTIEEFTLVEQSLRAGKDPTERIKRYALDLGFKHAPKQTSPDAAKIETIAEGQKANKTLANVGSPGNSKSANATALLEMSDTEFRAWMKKNPDGFRKLTT